MVVWTLVLGYVRSRGGRCAVASAGKRRVDQVDQIGTIPEIIRSRISSVYKAEKSLDHESGVRWRVAGIPNGLMMVLGSNFSFCAACRITCKRKGQGKVLPFVSVFPSPDRLE